jgi:hypothetical protein
MLSNVPVAAFQSWKVFGSPSRESDARDPTLHNSRVIAAGRLDEFVKKSPKKWPNIFLAKSDILLYPRKKVVQNFGLLL